MPFENLKKNQPQVLRTLTNAYNKNRLVQAYIFEGEKGCGKMDAALYLASILLCTSIQKPCFDCRNCQKIIEGMSENVKIVAPIGETIKKEQIENLIYEYTLTDLEGQNRLCIIDGADKLTTSAANTLLKFLEEPFPKRYIILTTENLDRIIDTIKSRCQTMHFITLSHQTIEADLVLQGIDRDVAFVLSNITVNVDEANVLIGQGMVIDIIDLATEVYDALQNGSDAYITFLKKGKFLTTSNEGNAPHLYFLATLQLLFRENICFLDNEKNSHFKKHLTKEKALANLINKIEIVNKYYERIPTYVNKDLTYASLFIELTRE